ncbi:hypothetical protein Btru_063404 [Bulinus truncatus]|nr:hypothetical protein Btru_063404 [Bulinus truncatus]
MRYQYRWKGWLQRITQILHNHTPSELKSQLSTSSRNIWDRKKNIFKVEVDNIFYHDGPAESSIYSIYCQHFLYDKDSQLCLLGSDLGSAGIKPLAGQHMYSILTQYCDVSLGYNSTIMKMYGLCLFVVNYEVSFADAQKECSNKQGQLLTIKSIYKKQKLLKILKDLNLWNIWIGLNDIQTEGVYIWSDGTVATATEMTMLFFANQPDNINNDDCVLLNLEYNGAEDTLCTFKKQLICEYEH